MLNNVPTQPIFAVPGNEGFVAFGVGEEASIGIEAMDGHSAFVSGVLCSYSLPPVVTATSGVLVVGRQYTIVAYVAGDDFGNVGGDNVTGEVFTASGTTPTDWSNGSELSTPGGLEIRVASTEGNVYQNIDITQDGPFTVYFQRALLLRSGESLFFILRAGGTGCVGKLNLLGVGGTLAFP